MNHTQKNISELAISVVLAFVEDSFQPSVRTTLKNSFDQVVAEHGRTENRAETISFNDWSLNIENLMLNNGSDLDGCSWIIRAVATEPMTSEQVEDVFYANGYNGAWGCSCSHDCCGHSSNPSVKVVSNDEGVEFILKASTSRNV